MHHVEMRAASAVDIALWDIFGQAINQPIFQALGGASRDDVRIYNTCAGYQYVRKAPAQVVDNYGLNQQNSPGPYEDLEGFLNNAGDLAQSLLEMGITGMKIWPFDFAAFTLVTVVNEENNIGQIDPYRGKNTVKYGIENGETVGVELVYNFDVPLRMIRLWQS